MKTGIGWTHMYQYRALSTDDFLTWVDHGGIFNVQDMDFGQGAGSCRISVSCENRSVRDAVIEMRLAAVDGECIAEVPVKATGGKLDYAVLTGPVRQVGGVHDLFLVARGGGADVDGYLFNINWLTFDRSREKL